MSSELLEMKRRAIALGLCGEYRDKWDNAADKKALVDIALDAKGIDMVADACANGWGMSTRYLLENFLEYINGRYISTNKRGYRSAMYVGLNRFDKIFPEYGNRTALDAVFDNGDIDEQKWRVLRDIEWNCYCTAMTLASTLCLFVDCEVKVYVPENAVCSLYVCRGCELDIECDGMCTIIEYGDDNAVKVAGKGKVHRKHVAHAAPRIKHGKKKNEV